MQSPNRLAAHVYPKLSILVAWLLLGNPSARVAATAAEPIRNPYFAERTWKVWSLDESPVSSGGATLRAPDDDARLIPLEPKSTGPFRFELRSDTPTPYAGFWDDVYCNQDKGHSHVIAAWKDDHGNVVSLRNGYISHQGVGTFVHRTGNRIDVGGDDLQKIGANFTSQSTTGMGHDITNSEIASIVVERAYYFANVLKSGPAHLSFYDIEPEYSDDKYEALNPTFYNSVGSSGSEGWALGKMLIAGGYLKKEVKQAAKRHGLYPATLLYIWKAGLPYDVPFGNELRHRVAYYSKGDHSDYLGPNQVEFNQWYHRYDETQHLRGMIAIAKSLNSVPPVAVLKDVQVSGARQVYAHKASALFHQVLDADVEIQLSAGDCYDLDGQPVSTRMEVLSGHPKIQIEQTGEGNYQVKIPGDAAFPQGRTCLALIANNGESDGNPAIITIYRHHAERNRRPEIAGVPAETNILPGERVSFPVDTTDPEGFDVSVHRPSHEVGTVTEGRFEWQSDEAQTLGEYPVTFIASDRTSGSSQSSTRSLIQVRSTVAEIAAKVSAGKAPLEVTFSAANSRDASGKQLQYQWDFDDAGVSAEEGVKHRFNEPDFYQVALDVNGTSRHRDTKVIHVRHDWPLQVNCDGKKDDAFLRDWGLSGSFGVTTKRVRDAGDTPEHELQLVKSDKQVGEIGLFLLKPLRTPFYLECEAKRKRGSPGAGLEVKGVLLGCPRGTTDPKPWGPDMSLVTNQASTRLITQPVWGRSSTTIRMYVSDDPASRGKLRFRGFVDWKQGSTYFRADGVFPDTRSIRVLLGDKPGTIAVNRLQIWYQ